VPIRAMSSVVGRKKRARSLNNPSLGVGPGMARAANTMAGTPAPTNETSEAWRGAKGKPPSAMTMAMIDAL